VPPFEAERDAKPPLPRPADLKPSLRLANAFFGLPGTRELFLGAFSSSSSSENELRLDVFGSASGSDAAEGG
jgi:hypothetical protein